MSSPCVDLIIKILRGYNFNSKRKIISMNELKNIGEKITKKITIEHSYENGIFKDIIAKMDNWVCTLFSLEFIDFDYNKRFFHSY